MSQTIASRNIATFTILGAGTGLIRTLIAKMVRKYRISRQRHILYAMPHELLRDVGVSYSDIDGLSEQIVDGRTDSTRRLRGAFTNGIV